MLLTFFIVHFNFFIIYQWYNSSIHFSRQNSHLKMFNNTIFCIYFYKNGCWHTYSPSWRMILEGFYSHSYTHWIVSKYLFLNMNLTYFVNILRMTLNLLVCWQCSTFKISKIIFKPTIWAVYQVGFREIMERAQEKKSFLKRNRIHSLP